MLLLCKGLNLATFRSLLPPHEKAKFGKRLQISSAFIFCSFSPGLKKAMGIGDEAAAQAAAENEPKSRLEILTDVERMSSGLITEGNDLISEDLVQ